MSERYERAAHIPGWEIDFTDVGYPGLTVVCTVPTVRARAEWWRLGPLLDSRDPSVREPAIVEAGVLFSASLIEWNVDWLGEPVPTTPDGVLGVDKPLLSIVLAVWRKRCWNQSRPKPERADVAGDAEREEVERLLAGAMFDDAPVLESSVDVGDVTSGNDHEPVLAEVAG